MPHPRPGSPVTGTLTILGPGVLGRSLARHAAHQGMAVRLLGRNPARVAEAVAALNRLEPAHPVTGGTDWTEALDGADAVLEALPENLSIKAEALARLASESAPDTLLLTGTSAIPLGELRLAAALSRPLIGFHLFVPVRRMRMLELVAEAGTPPASLDQARRLAANLGLRVAQVRDQPGFAATRMALVQGLEAIRLLEAGEASATDLDALMAHGYGHPCGPLELSDRIGLDLRLALADQLFARTGDPRFEAPPLLRRLVAEGRLGRRSGRGFHTWNERGERC